MKISKALIIKEKGTLEKIELPIPKINQYEVLIRTHACSLCTLERRVFSGARTKGFPFLGGHEFSAEVIQVGEGVLEVKVGDKVVVTSQYCNQCEYCRTGRGTQCLNKQHMIPRVEFDGWIQGGGLCEYLRVSAWQLIRLPDDINLVHATLTEPLACCVHSIKRARIKIGETVLIVGFGIMGYFHLKLAKMQGARVIVSDADDVRLESAMSHGANHIINPKISDLKSEIMLLTQNQGVDVVINTVANPTVWKGLIDLVSPMGRLVAYSSQDRVEPIPIDFNLVHAKEIEFVGTINPTIEDNEVAVKLIKYGLIEMDPVIDSVYPFKDSEKAFEHASQPNTYRVAIKFQ